MELDKTQTEIVDWDLVDEGYVKLEKDKAKKLLIIDWEVKKIKKFVDEKTKELKENVEFNAVVLSEDDKPVKKVFSTTSMSALKGLKEVLREKDPKYAVLIRIKKIGEGKSTVYDIEEQQMPQ